MEQVQALLERSDASLGGGATRRAVDEAQQALALARGDDLLELRSLDALGSALWARGELDHARVVMGAADRLRERTCQPPPVPPVPEMVPGSYGWEEGRLLRPDEVLVLLSVGRSTSGRPVSGWGSLTASERQVVELAAARLTNPQIARQLFLSTNTVKTHLQRAFRKLGVSNRAELSQAPR